MSDHKGFSEETCVRCGWTMGQPPLNCQNDDTPHRFPSQALTEPAWNEQPCLCGNTKVWVMPGMEFKGLRCHLCPPEPTKPTLRLVQT